MLQRNLPTTISFCAGSDPSSILQICLGLQKLTSKPIPVGLNNLTWTLIKPMQYETDDLDESDMELMAENYIKLNVALEVMHECFEPVKEPRTKRDLVEDVIFNRGSELNRLNFRGFYTVLLERDEELITVAAIRFYGEQVAEVPLVGTRFQYRRHGMCRILMNELEKRLMELSVERLILPVVPSVLNTWITAFGFSQMTKFERLEFLAYTFLDFQGTVMCQKHLRKLPRSKSSVFREQISSPDMNQNHPSPPREHPIVTHHEACSIERGSSKSSEFDGDSSTMSEVFPSKQHEQSEVADQGPFNIKNVDISGGCESQAPPVAKCADDEKVDRHNSDGQFKCYKRKKALDVKPMPQSDYPNVQTGSRIVESSLVFLVIFSCIVEKLYMVVEVELGLSVLENRAVKYIIQMHSRNVYAI
ncbi:hypothetical protein Nepgr_014549 [Nepenthes gracilis]|uniref:N-acetyltransferase domain-containing protein n=1 Tax=Nepenthes gracilis TaxID=150966 RepID=A0AAD3SJQ6_NEPGR|nr:hypothetical protein Nepgr_014549 [Nepenthes gracilis]